jgi:copper chaperone CopZ
MKILKLSLAAAALLALTTSAPAVMACPGKGDHAKKEEKAPAKRVASASFRVDGMHCEGCGDKVKEKLAAQAGILKVDVKLADKRVTVEYDADKLSVEAIAKLITEMGYKASAEA